MFEKEIHMIFGDDFEHTEELDQILVDNGVEDLVPCEQESGSAFGQRIGGFYHDELHKIFIVQNKYSSTNYHLCILLHELAHHKRHMKGKLNIMENLLPEKGYEPSYNQDEPMYEEFEKLLYEEKVADRYASFMFYQIKGKEALVFEKNRFTYINFSLMLENMFRELYKQGRSGYENYKQNIMENLKDSRELINE